MNAVLYAGLLPLWDGFDEAFHYGYVQELGHDRKPLVFWQATLSSEVWDSLALAPGSYIAKRNVPAIISFDDYFARPGSERLELRQRLEHLCPHSAARPSQSPNYEVHQAPLAYAILAVIDVALARVPLLRRVLFLRLFGALASTLATGVLGFWLAAQMGLGERWRLSAVYLVFSSQMFYATTAHVANDWLAVPLFALLIVCAISLERHPTTTKALGLLAVLAAGLLTKAYFLALVPFAVLVVLRLGLIRKLSWRGISMAAAPLTVAGAWYGRNLRLYHNLSGMPETMGSGIPFGRLIAALPHFSWGRAIDVTASSSLWTGNNSFTAFSSRTVHGMMVLLLIAILLYLRGVMGGSQQRADWLVIAAIVSYVAALIYCAVLLWSENRGGLLAVPPWYTQVLLPPGICLCMLGLKSSRCGNAIRILMLGAWGYCICATYLAKLIPLYAGYPADRARVADLLRWYWQSHDSIGRTLLTTALIPSAAVWMLVAAVTACAVGIGAMLAWL